MATASLSAQSASRLSFSSSALTGGCSQLKAVSLAAAKPHSSENGRLAVRCAGKGGFIPAEHRWMYEGIENKGPDDWNRTYYPKEADHLNVEKQWYIVDAADKRLGRLASTIANHIRGKDQPTYTPSVDMGAYVIVVNAEKVAVTGKKRAQKIYRRHSGRPGGMTEETFDQVQARIPERIVEHAVRGMLPKGRLGRRLFTHLKVYKGESHPHEAQVPQPLPIHDKPASNSTAGTGNAPCPALDAVAVAHDAGSGSGGDGGETSGGEGGWKSGEEEQWNEARDVQNLAQLSTDSLAAFCQLWGNTSREGGYLVMTMDGVEAAVFNERPGQPLEPPPDASLPVHLTWCSQLLYGTLDAGMVWAWAEYHRVHANVSRFIFYDMAAWTPALTALFTPYFAAGVAAVTDMSAGRRFGFRAGVELLYFTTKHQHLFFTPPSHPPDPSQQRLHIPLAPHLALGDLHDTDEFLSPVPPHSLPSLLATHAHAPWLSHGAFAVEPSVCQGEGGEDAPAPAEAATVEPADSGGVVGGGSAAVEAATAGGAREAGAAVNARSRHEETALGTAGNGTEGAEMQWDEAAGTEAKRRAVQLLSRMVFRHPDVWCMRDRAEGQQIDSELCEDWRGHRKLIVNPRKTEVMSIHIAREPQKGGVVLNAATELRHFHLSGVVNPDEWNRTYYPKEADHLNAEQWYIPPHPPPSLDITAFLLIYRTSGTARRVEPHVLPEGGGPPERGAVVHSPSPPPIPGYHRLSAHLQDEWNRTYYPNEEDHLNAEQWYIPPHPPPSLDITAFLLIYRTSGTARRVEPHVLPEGGGPPERGAVVHSPSPPPIPGYHRLSAHLQDEWNRTYYPKEADHLNAEQWYIPPHPPPSLDITAFLLIYRTSGTARRVEPQVPYYPKEADHLNVEKQWYIVDAADKRLGRLASTIANHICGKDQPTYTPSVDMGAYVIVVNAEKVAVTGKKRAQKIYRRHSGRPGGMTEETFDQVHARIPERIVEHAVRGMLPKGRVLMRNPEINVEHAVRGMLPKGRDVRSMLLKGQMGGGEWG
ncbi:unnamed protein product [Closterium sp. Naga37s-1]|nr:unnamed protein product [Closterium sp. Naga37s-1]